VDGVHIKTIPLTLYALLVTHTHTHINTLYIQTYNVTCTACRFNATEKLIEAEMLL